MRFMIVLVFLVISVEVNAKEFILYDITSPSGERTIYAIDESEYPYKEVSYLEAVKLFTDNMSVYMASVDDFVDDADLQFPVLREVTLRNMRLSNAVDVWVVVIECAAMKSYQHYKKRFVFLLNGNEILPKHQRNKKNK